MDSRAPWCTTSRRSLDRISVRRYMPWIANVFFSVSLARSIGPGHPGNVFASCAVSTFPAGNTVTIFFCRRCNARIAPCPGRLPEVSIQSDPGTMAKSSGAWISQMNWTFPIGSHSAACGRPPLSRVHTTRTPALVSRLMIASPFSHPSLIGATPGSCPSAMRLYPHAFQSHRRSPHPGSD